MSHHRAVKSCFLVALATAIIPFHGAVYSAGVSAGRAAGIAHRPGDAAEAGVHHMVRPGPGSPHGTHERAFFPSSYLKACRDEGRPAAGSYVLSDLLHGCWLPG